LLDTSPNCVWLLRHGLSTFNAEKRCQGGSDGAELTDEGRRSARLTGEILRPLKFDLVLTSPLARARETAMQVLGGWSGSSRRVIPTRIDPRLQEVRLYTWEGALFDSIRANFPKDFDDWQSRPHRFRLRSESGDVRFPVLDLFGQARSFWSEFLAARPGKRVLIVTHGGTARALILTLLGLSPKGFQSIQQSNLGLTILRLPDAPAAPGSVELLNSTSHLTGKPPKLKAGRRGLRLVLQVGATDKSGEIVVCRLQEPVKLDGALGGNGYGHFACGVEEAIPRLSSMVRRGEDSGLESIYVKASRQAIENVLRHMPGFDFRLARRLRLRAGAFTVVHFPGKHLLPVLQGLNLPEHGSSADAYLAPVRPI